jgi:L-ribulose-5-phosphate 3-epimerase
MQKSINAWSVEKTLDFEAMFTQVKAAGFDGIELNLDNENSSAHSLTFSTSPEALAKVKTLSEKFNLPVVSISTSLFGATMGSADPDKRAVAMKVVRRQLEIAKTLGATGILVVPGGLSDDVSLRTARENCMQTLGALKADIEAIGIFVGVENVWNRFFTSPYDMSGFIDELGSRSIGAYFDVGNVVEFSDPENWIDILGRRIGKIHVKDFKRRQGAYSGGEWVDLLAGSVNWRKVVPALKAAGFDGYLTAEVGKSQPEQSGADFYAMVAAQLAAIIEMGDQ